MDINQNTSSKLTKEQGEHLIKEARKYLQSLLSGKDHKISSSEEWLNKRYGLFVTLHTHPTHDLRGCIGFTEPIYPLHKALKEAASSAALYDPRFPKVTKEELNNLIIEISILTPPQIIPHQTPKELLEKITPKKDGLILKTETAHGLFLPQVWDQLPKKTEFLENLSYKAGLFDKDAWQHKDTEIYKFHVQIFEESAPNSKITEIKE
ncbi:MAG: TIGR00296 family protein [Candidatus Nanohalarchaeota archaeon]|nr:MAG: TIGR00296 family protein [Candidatus Nanohaloarchaeota archaeon]